MREIQSLAFVLLLILLPEVIVYVMVCTVSWVMRATAPAAPSLPRAIVVASSLARSVRELIARSLAVFWQAARLALAVALGTAAVVVAVSALWTLAWTLNPL